MQTFYHTFGLGHTYSGKVQPIIAENNTDALRAMFKKYGNRWAFQYTEKQWMEHPTNEKYLRIMKAPPIENYKATTAG